VLNRRGFLVHTSRLCAAMAVGSEAGSWPERAGVRRFHACISALALERHPELPAIVARAGVSDVWMAGFLFGYWYRTPAQLRQLARVFEGHGLRTHIVNVPLGHPGNALGVVDENTPVTPPAHWRFAQRPDGSAYAGTSIHPPAQEENVRAIRDLHRAGFREVFLDDDFRVAISPGQIGGCFCPACREEFLQSTGYRQDAIPELLDCVATRTPSAVLGAWIDHWCGKLHDMLLAQQRAMPGGEVGIMVMYLGAEKAGIPLDRLSSVPFRVGELMFDDASFGTPKGKADELFSALFHRRFSPPESAYSETTAYPADRLSARNMAAKLTVSLIADVRNTMFMSGLLPFPIEHWDALGPAMAESARLHERIAGHRPQGPVKHYFGVDERLVGEDQPFSLFLAMGVPFEVVDELPTTGWTFLGNADARAVAEGRLRSHGRRLYVRPGVLGSHRDLIPVSEDLSGLMALKQTLIPRLRGVPYVLESVPAVLAWYPTAHCGLVWNLSEQAQRLTVSRDGAAVACVDLPPLSVRLVEGLGPAREGPLPAPS